MALAVALGGVAIPQAAAAAPSVGYCENVRFSITQDMPSQAGQATVQQFYIDDSCHVRVTAAAEVATFTDDALAESSVLGSLSSPQGGLVALSTISRVGYGSTQIWDCCGILLTEHWLELRWDSTYTVVSSWGATHGAKWHREGGGFTGWSLDLSNSSLARVSGGNGQAWIRVKGRQGFSYQGVFDPTGTQFYNDLSDTVTGSANGGMSCIHEYYLRKVPLGPLAWKPAVVKCVRSAYPNP